MSVESKQELLFLSSEVKNGNILPEKSQFGDKIPNNHQDFWQLWNSHQSYLYNCCLKWLNCNYPEVLNVKILRIVSKLCIGIGDTKFDQLMTLFSIDNGFYLGKTQRL